MDVGRVQPGLTPVSSGPLRFGPRQPHAGAAGVVMHLPARVENGVDVRMGEEVRRSMWPVEHADLPIARQVRSQCERESLHGAWRAHALGQMQYIACGEVASSMSTEAPQGECRAT